MEARRRSSKIFPEEGQRRPEMVLVDTSVWITHLRSGVPELVALLNDGYVACHRAVIGELACGNLKNRDEILSLLGALPIVQDVEDDELLQFIENFSLMGKGLGYIDMHLLASAVMEKMPLWTLDKRLDETARKLGVRYTKG